jgi:hypothetical protein
MPSRHSRNPAFNTAKSAWKITEKTAVGLARWSMKDHTGTAKLLANLPPMGFIDTLSMLLVNFVIGLLGAVASGAMLFLLITFGIPALLFM